MLGRFEGMSDAEWELFKNIFPEKAQKWRGIPAAHPRKLLNSLLFILVTGCRWCDLPRGGQSASKKRKPPLAEGMAFRRKIQRIAGVVSWSCAE